MRTLEDGDQILRHEIDSISESMQLADKGPCVCAASRPHHASWRRSANSSNEWNGGFPKLEHWMANGLPSRFMDNYERAREELNKTISPPQRRRRKLRVNREEGCEIDPTMWASGSMQCWHDIHHTAQHMPLVRIGADVTLMAADDEESMTWRGTAAIALCDLLTKFGINTEMYVYENGNYAWDRHGTRYPNAMYVNKVMVKQAHEVISPQNTLIAFATKEYSRTVMHGLIHVLAPYRSNPGLGGYGRLGAREHRDTDVMIDHHIKDLESAVDFVRTSLSRFSGKERCAQ